MASKPDEVRDGVPLTHLDEPLFEGAGATKRQFVDYLDAVAELIIPELRDRPLSVIRVTGGDAFMQKNLPSYTPEWIARVGLWAEASKRTVTYALCNDKRTLLWFANQRAVEYHPTLVRTSAYETPTHLVLDLDPPEGGGFAAAANVALVVRAALDEVGMKGAAKTSGAKGLHVIVPITPATHEQAAAATRALARRVEQLDPAIATTAFLKEDRAGKVFVDATRTGGATVVACYSPRARPGVPVSFPLPWEQVGTATPGEFTVHSVPGLIGEWPTWDELLPKPQKLPADLVDEGHEIPVPRVAAMHEGKRRAKARRSDQS
jgi:DNA ligase D-like protein (predicted polymerase)